MRVNEDVRGDSQKHRSLFESQLDPRELVLRQQSTNCLISMLQHIGLVSSIKLSYMKKYSKQIWDRVAQDYDIIWEIADYTPILRCVIQGAGIDSGMSVLDVATGTGMVCTEVAKKVGEHGRVLGIDYSKPMLKEATKKAEALGLRNIDLILADAHNLPISNDHFDAVISCFTIPFLSSPQKAVKEIVRAVRTHGKVVSVEWESPPLNFWAEQRKRAGIHDFRESELIKILHNSGLRKIQTERVEVLHRRPNVSEELVGRSQLVSAAIMGLKENDAQGFFSKIREEYQKLSPMRKHGWLPVFYVGTKC
jgi:ubiquinone/menaquinone biosynthesis C-methylase UbiE